jgi:hypothetical protein
MKLSPQSLIRFVLAGSCVIATACTTAPTTNSNQRGGNANGAQSTTPQTNSSAKSSPQADQSTTGSIEVTSVPPGARVLLVSTDAGAGEPQSKGSTPTTITGLQPGKYTVDLEKPGYRFFQKEVEVKPGKTLKVNAPLKKQ